MRRSPRREDEYKLGKYVYPVIGDMLMEEITRDDIKGRLLGSIARPIADAQGNPMADEHGRPVLAGAVQADRVRALVSTVFNWARQEKGVSVVNPAALIDNLAVGGERQAVDEASVARLWPVLSRATDNITTWRAWAVARMAFLSGKRLQEISGARKSELDLDGTLPIWTLGGGRSGRKNSKPHSVPLPPMLRELFREAIRRSDHPTLVFPSEVKDGPIHKRTVSDRLTDAYAECNITGVDFHSIRHTVETQLAKIGISDETRDRILDHGKKMKKSEGYRYNHYDYYQPKYAALERLEKHLDQMINAKQTGAEIVALETASA